MASSLFPGAPKGPMSNGNPLSNAIGSIKAMMGGNPNQMYEQMYNSNPQFRQFADKMQGKTPEEAFRENGFDYDQIKRFMR